MPVIGAILVVFGLLIIIVEELLSLLVGIVFILIGGSIVLTGLAFKNGKKQSIRFGGYEIFKNKR